MSAFRLHNHHLVHKTISNPVALVHRMGGMQAQDYAMAKWGVGCRLEGVADAAVEKAVNDGKIIRIHVLRPTWHFVTAEDARWMMALTVPHLLSAMRSNDILMGLDDKTQKRSLKIIERELTKNGAMTRRELIPILGKAGIPVHESRPSHLMFHAEMKGVACSGPRRGKQATYCLYEARIPSGKMLSRDEALHELATRYFTSHGPATLNDFAWWSGLPKADARKAVEMVKDSFIKETVGEQTYLLPETPIPKSSNVPLFLPAFDEFLIGYSDRSASLNVRHAAKTFTNNGIFRPIILVGGKVVGLWNRTLRKEGANVEYTFFRGEGRVDKKTLKEAIAPFREFLG